MRTGPFAGFDTCLDCGTPDTTLAYRSGRMRRCIDCQAYYNLTHRSHGRAVPMAYTREEFTELKRTHGRRCSYCGIGPDGLYELDVCGTNGRRYETIGWDRIDNDLGYQDGNWRTSCAICNGVKSNVLTAEEMQIVGPVIRATLEARRRGDGDLAAVADSVARLFPSADSGR